MRSWMEGHKNLIDTALECLGGIPQTKDIPVNLNNTKGVITAAWGCLQFSQGFDVMPYLAENCSSSQ